jgi:Tol biopolymer transport system component
MERLALLTCLVLFSPGLALHPALARAAEPYAPVRFLTSGNVDLWPSFSSDGGQVLFTRGDGADATFWLVPVAGGQPRPFSSSPMPVAATRPNWSTQNNRIVFTGIANGHGQVWLIEADGSNARRVMAAGLSDAVFYPSWYPDGNMVAVMDAQDFVIKKIDLTRGFAVPLTQQAQVMTGMPSVSPDGKAIAFAGQENRGQHYDQTKNSIWLIDATGVARPLESTPAQGRAPTWSPDGRRLAFESNRASLLGLYAIFLINRDGTGLVQVTDSSLNADHPVWSPDDRRLAFSARPFSLQKGRGIAIIDLPGAYSPEPPPPIATPRNTPSDRDPR